MELVDAICSNPDARSVVEYSLTPCFRRSYSTIFKRINEMAMDELAIAHLLAPYLPRSQQRPFFLVMTDSLGTFYTATDVADLDGDGDLDVLLHNVRQESEFTAFSVATLWFNEGEGRFVARRVEQDAYGGGWASAAGDVDMDGDNDIALFMGYQLRLLLNQGSSQEGQPGEFRLKQSIAGPERNGQYGSVLLGDLNNDGYLDGIVAGCCGRLFSIDPTNYAPNVSGVWLNTRPAQGLGMQMTTLTDLDGLAVPDAALGLQVKVKIETQPTGCSLMMETAIS